VPRQSRTGSRADVALLGATLMTALVVLLLPAPVRQSLHATLRDTFAAPFVSLQAWAQRGRLAITDRGRLVQQVDSLALTSAATPTLRAENERLRALLGLGRRLEWGFVATELLPAPQGGDEHAVTVNAGTESGVRQFSPVVTPAGLIGVITQVQQRTATAILWTHPDFRASATTEDGSAFGIVSSHLSGTGAERALLELRGVPFRASLKPGTVIVTSGLGQVFPKGVPIGIVLREVRTLEGWARTYLVRPMVSPGELGSAMVLLPPRAAAGVEAAWATPAAAEGRQRLIVTAADSVIADSLARIESRLRRLDSLRRAAIFAGDSGIVREIDALRGVDPAAGDSLPLDSLARPLAPGAVGDTVAPRGGPVGSRRDSAGRPLRRDSAAPSAATAPRTGTPLPRPSTTAPRATGVPPTGTPAAGTPPRPARSTGPNAAPAAGSASGTAPRRPATTTTATPASGGAPGTAPRRPATTAPAPPSTPRPRATTPPATPARRDSAAARNRARPRPPADTADRPFRLPDSGAR
jgi:rod shape-determining protein MreC